MVACFSLVLMRNRGATSMKPGGPGFFYRLIDDSHYEEKEVFFSEFKEFDQRPWQEKKFSLI
jgi:hypothetical protein